MVDDKMRIWDAVAKTDPAHTKKVTFGRTFTSIDAHWQIQQATKQFGPIGEGWGYDVKHGVERLTDTLILATADVTIWWSGDQLGGDPPPTFGPIRATCEMYGPKTKFGKVIPGEFVCDEDSPKKAMTDALTKGLSHLGFSADVFLGLFDDNRYVQKMEREFKDGAAGAANRALDEAAREITAATGETRSTYQIAKDKKALENLDANARADINKASSRAELKIWWKAHKDGLVAKLPEADYAGLVVAFDAKWDALPA